MNLPRRLPQLDVLRGIAVLIVMIAHSSGDAPALHLGTLFRFGWTGVDLFFVLSGFLITGILLRAKSEANYFRNFYARRVLRIWPLYFCLLVFGFLVIPVLQPHLRPTVAEQCHPWQSYFLFVQNLMVPLSGSFGPLQITWSLCVEEQFYLVWPLVVLLCSPKNIVRISIGAVLLSVGLRLADVHQWIAIDTYHNTLCRLDGLAIGSIAAIALPRYPAKLVRQVSWGIGAFALTALLVTVSFDIAKWAFLGLVSLFFGAAMCLSITWGTFPRARFMAFTGRISYGLYLLHVLAFDVVRDRHIRPWLALSHNPVVNDAVVFACSMVFALALAQISWKLLESPALLLKRYFEPCPTATPTSTSCLPTLATPAA